MLVIRRRQGGSHRAAPRPQQGLSLLEVLVTIVILAFGLMGLAALQMRIQAAENEAFQRAQAILLVQDMINRISANRSSGKLYITGTPLGTGNTTCETTTLAGRDLCEWSNALRGAAEKLGGSAVGAMVGARGCIESVGTNPDVLRVSVTWVGMAAMGGSSLSCASSQFTTAEAPFRRAIASVIAVPVLNKTP